MGAVEALLLLSGKFRFIPFAFCIADLYIGFAENLPRRQEPASEDEEHRMSWMLVGMVCGLTLSSKPPFETCFLSPSLHQAVRLGCAPKINRIHGGCFMLTSYSFLSFGQIYARLRSEDTAPCYSRLGG